MTDSTSRIAPDEVAALIERLREHAGVVHHIQQTAQPTREWIPVGEQLPDARGDYLVFPGAYSDPIAIEQWVPSFNCFLLEIDNGKRATHWMPLPPPPAADK